LTFISAVGSAAQSTLGCLPAGAPTIEIGWEPLCPNAPIIAVTNNYQIELRLAGRGSEQVLLCRFNISTHDPLQIRRLLGRAYNDRRTTHFTAGLILLLALCGWVIGGDEAAQSLVVGATPPREPTSLPSQEAMRQRFGASLLNPAAAPKLFAALREVSRRARLPQTPSLYVIPGRDQMNAYALGSPDASTITLTEGLLRGMHPAEITGIIAHEVAHICSSDGWTMSFAGALQQAITSVAPAGCLLAHARGAHSPLRSLETLLACAPALARLLYLGLSRVRELDADALALQLTDDPRNLVAALAKLEHHHNGPAVLSAAVSGADVTRYLRSHPTTHDRVGMLLDLAA
jgi:heat shock protein HtpX